MNDGPKERMQRPPLPFDRKRAERTLAALAQAGFPVPDAQRPLLDGLFGNSPYLARLAIREAQFLQESIGRAPDDVLGRIHAEVGVATSSGSLADAMAILRRGKRQAALTIALADISGDWTVEQVTRDRKSTRLNSSHVSESRMPSS